MTQSQPKDILFFAEDPGAINYLRYLPEVFEKKGFASVLVIDGPALGFMGRCKASTVRAPDFQHAPHLLDIFNPKVVMVGTSEDPKSLGLSILENARKLEIPTIGVVDAFMNAAYRFRGLTKDPLAFAPDLLIVPDTWTKAEYIRLGYSEKQVEACGHPQYDSVKSWAAKMSRDGKDSLRVRYFPKAPKDSIVVVFVAEQAGGLNSGQYERSQEYTLFGRGGSRTRNEIVLEEFLDAMALLDKRPYLTLRLPPKGGSDGFERYLEEFDQLSLSEPILEILYAADCVFGMTTTALLEAAVIGRPTFSILPREEEKNWLSTIRFRMTRCATTRTELRGSLPKFFEGIQKTAPSPGNKFVFGATERVVGLVEKLLENTRE